VPGLFITFEGGEGCGKTTQLRALAAALRAVGHEPVEARDPGGTTIGDRIRQLLLDGAHARMAPLAELLLYEASRTQLVREVIRPALAAGRPVLCDRFTDSSLAYQGYGRGLDLALIRQLNDLATDGLCPELTLLLDLDPTLGLARVRQRLDAAGPDRLEREQLTFHQRVRAGFVALARQDAARILVLDGARDAVDIAADIRRRAETALAGRPAAVS
jgi:dTMP kinase